IGPIPLNRIATLNNPALPGTVVIKRRAFFDNNLNNQLDPNECAGDWVVYTITVNNLILDCPGDISRNNDNGLCGATVTYTPTIIGSPQPVVSFEFSGATINSGSGDGSGSFFNLGQTTVTITATNDCGTQVCSFHVTVNDTEPPVITCPGPLSVNNTP